MKKILAVLMIIAFSATSAYAGPNNHNQRDRRTAVHKVQTPKHRAQERQIVKVKRSNAGAYLFAGFIGGVLANNMITYSQPRVVYNTVQVQTPVYTNNVSCTTTVSYDGRTTTETCTTVGY